MASTTTRTNTTDGLVSVYVYSRSSCGNFDHSEGWIECPHCSRTLSDEWDDSATEAELNLHRARLCLAIDAAARYEGMYAAHIAAEWAVTYPGAANAAEEPF